MATRGLVGMYSPEPGRTHSQHLGRRKTREGGRQGSPGTPYLGSLLDGCQGWVSGFRLASVLTRDEGDLTEE